MKHLKTLNPYTQSVVYETPYCEQQALQYKIDEANQSALTWKKVPVRERVNLLQEALAYFEKNQDQIAKDITLSMGKPIRQSQNEVKTFFERARYLCSIAEETLKDDHLPEKQSLYRAIRHEPLGVILVISPWNYPLLVTVNSVVPGLLSGNTILLKPSSITPIIGQHFENAFGRLGPFQNLLQNVILDHQTTLTTIENPDIHHVVFTGSVNAGHTIYQSVSKRLIDCNLELGGKDGAYVAEDANVEQAVAGLVDGALYNAGQSCCGIERVYVHKAHYPSFVKRALALVQDYKLGDPLLPETTLGPLAKAESYETLEHHIQDAREKGAKVLYGGYTETIGCGRFFLPTLVTDLHKDMFLMQEENFGPILPIQCVENDAEGFQEVAHSEFGLTAAIYTESLTRAEAFSAAIDAGTIFMNRCDYLDPALPWTGVKNSGKGSSLSRYGFYALTRRKAIHFKMHQG